MYIFQDYTLYLVGVACYFGVNYSKEYILTWFVLLVIFVIFFLLTAQSSWNAGQDKYSKLKEKEKMANDNLYNENPSA